jgi:hypothetical protein
MLARLQRLSAPADVKIKRFQSKGLTAVSQRESATRAIELDIIKKAFSVEEKHEIK